MPQPVPSGELSGKPLDALKGGSTPQPAIQIKVPSNLVTRDPFSGKRRALKNKYETAQYVVFWDSPLEGKTDAQTLDHVKRFVVDLEVAWNAWTKAGFSAKDRLGLGKYKKTVFLKGCPGVSCTLNTPPQAASYDFQGVEDNQMYLSSGGGYVGIHELAHIRQAATGGFSNNSDPALQSRMGWVYESGAHYMTYCLSGNKEAEDATDYFGTAITDWAPAWHASSVELWDGGKNGNPYGLWIFMLWVDTRFGAGTVGRMWNENVRDANGTSTELFPECLARLTKKNIPDLWGDWVASTLTFSYLRSPRFSRLLTHLGGGWTVFDPLTVEGTRAYGTKPLQALGFHAFKLDSRFANKRLRLETSIDPSSWRLVVVTGGKPLVYGSGTITASVGVGTLLGIVCGTRGNDLPPSGSYSLSIL